MAQDRPLFGVMLMLGFCVLAPMGDAMAKLLGETAPLLMLLFFRFGIQALLLLPFAARDLTRLSGRVWRLSALRTLLHILGVGAMFGSLRFLPLAEAVAIAFVMPFIMLLLGKVFLKEEVGSRRLAACAVGFVGVLLVVQPSFAEVGAPALLPLFVAVVFALFMLVTRQVAKDAAPVTLQLLSGVIATPALFLLWLAFGGLHFDFGLRAPDGREAMLLLAVGALGTFAHLMMTWSLRFAPSATLAPMQYLEIPFATLVGWVVFRDLPDGLAAIGICVTVAAGLYVIARERATARLAARLAAPPAV